MNSLFLARGADAELRVKSATACLAASLNCTAEAYRTSGGVVGVARDGEVLMGQASQGEVTLYFLGTLFDEVDGWDGERAPIEDPDGSALWLLERYNQLGLNFLDRLPGQYSVVLHDAADDRWIFAADPFGGRTLYLSQGEEACLVATKLDLVAAMLGEDLQLDREYEDFFLVHGFYPHGRTPFSGVRSLAAGELLELHGGAWTSHAIAQPDWGMSDPADMAQGLTASKAAGDALEALFLDSMRAMLPRTKQKVGVLLGGFDSALVAAAAVKLGYPVTTYSFRYARSSFNQPHTDTLSQFCGCDHVWVDVDQTMIEEGLQNFPRIFSQPTNWPNYVIQTHRVMERMKADGIAYCYSGDGCDATFLGYPGTYARARLIESLPRLPGLAHGVALKLASQNWLERSLGHPYRVALGLLRGMGRAAHERDYLSFRIMDETTLAQLRTGQQPKDLEPEIARLSAPHAGLPGVRRTYLGKAAVSPNRSKMIASADATGIPILAPYMHPRLKRFALALPLDLLRPASGGAATGKTVLADMAVNSGLLPHEIVHQPKMAAVDAPVDEWYDGPLRRRMLEYFADLPFAANLGYLNRMLDIKWAETQFKQRIMTDKVISHAASLLATYSRFAALVKR